MMCICLQCHGCVPILFMYVCVCVCARICELGFSTCAFVSAYAYMCQDASPCVYLLSSSHTRTHVCILHMRVGMPLSTKPARHVHIHTYLVRMCNTSTNIHTSVDIPLKASSEQDFYDFLNYFFLRPTNAPKRADGSEAKCEDACPPA